MATLVLDNRALALRIDGQALAFYENGERRGSLPIKLLERVILQGDLSLSAGVLTRLAENGTAVLMLSKRHSRRLAVVLGPAHNDAAVRIAQAQRLFDQAWCAWWARRQIAAKTRAQVRVLKQAMAKRPDCHYPLARAVTDLEHLCSHMDSPQQPPSVERLRGFEGAAARAYFQGLTVLFPPSLGFTGRSRRPPRDPVNACLSLVYTLLHFEAVRAAHMAGLDPLLGFYHRPAFGRESLASDLIEPLRPHADQWVWRLFQNRTLRAELFSRDGQACLLGKTGREVFYQHYEAHFKPVRRLLQRQCRRLAAYFRQQGTPFLEEDEA
ncbi:CRISPR-associated endonuclease Cas1 [Tepidimonas charontis]|uniref:CRISPR-associated endonuclease Cas1 n=2 Tax=Tepidimonas charontis TaxID=2267262 RepID=A0A554X7S1_9BURK|nr:CRISPR-associated endonuclease Cas1 [Tepidimonas charontis]